jgi:splicing factor 3A subunit 1
LPITAVTATDQSKKKVAQHVSTNVKASIPNPIALLAKNPPTEAPYPFEFSLAQPSGVSAAEMDIIKLTAQYTAVNGRTFLAALAQREQKNPLFDFLKPTHLLFGFFTSLVDSYAKIVNPSDNLKQRVKQRQRREYVLEACVQRWSWSHAEAERQRSARHAGDDSMTAAQNVDWNDFTVVEVIDFGEHELLDLPGLTPVTADDMQQAIGRRPPPPSAGQAAALRPPPPPPAPSAALVPPPPPPPQPPVSTKMDADDEEDPDIKVVANYTPRIAGSSGSSSGPAMTIDPITSKVIPVHQLEEHMRIQLLDPKWKEELKRFQDKQTGFTGSLGATEGDTIAESLKLFAKKRGDIFGQSTGAGSDSARKIAEAQMMEQQQYQASSSLQWDGRAGSAASVLQQRDDLAAIQGPSAAGVYSAYNVGTVSTAQGPTLAPPPPPPSMAMPPMPPMPGMPGMPAPPLPPMPMLPPVGLAPPLGVPLAPPLPPMHPSLAGAVPPMAPLPLAASAAMTVVVSGAPSTENDGRPQAKRSRVGDDADAGATASGPLISAEEFAAKYPGPITLHVVIPHDASSSHWQFNGQTVQLSLPHGVSATVKDVKELLAAQHLANMPTNKLQLRSPAIGFWKDTSTLASLNIAGGAGCAIEASVKSRGGKR